MAHRMIWKISICFCVCSTIAGAEVLSGPVDQDTCSVLDTKSVMFRLDTMCGPNCLWQIARVYGKDYSLKDIAEFAGTHTIHGTTVKGMKQACQHIGLPAEAIRTTMEVLANDQRVAILLLNVNDLMHYVILDHIGDSEVRLLDATVFREMTIHELESIWTGVVILVGDPPINRRFGVALALQVTGLAAVFASIVYYSLAYLIRPNAVHKS